MREETVQHLLLLMLTCTLGMSRNFFRLVTQGRFVIIIVSRESVCGILWRNHMFFTLGTW